MAVLNIGSATLTLIVCVGLLHRFHKNLNPSIHPGTGVVTSGGAYFSEIGKILTFGGASSRLGDRGSIALPFVVVLSGKSKIGLLGCLVMRAGNVVICEAFSCESVVKGWSRGGRKARKVLLRREVRVMKREVGYVVVKIGSKIAAR